MADAELFTVAQLADISENPDPVLHRLDRDRAALVPEMKRAGITTPARMAAFLGNVAQETDRLKTLEEYGGFEYWLYLDSHPDGGPGEWRYHGRGYLMVTWSSNYRALSDALGMDFVDNPDLLKQPEWAAKAAAWYWTNHDLNAYADRGDYLNVCSIINTGEPGNTPNHWEDRLYFYERAKRVLATGVPATAVKFKPNLVAVGSQDEEAAFAAAKVYRRRGFDVTVVVGPEGVMAFDEVFSKEPLGTRQMVVVGGPALVALLPGSAQNVHHPYRLENRSDYVGAVGQNFQDTLRLLGDVLEATVGEGAKNEFEAVYNAGRTPPPPEP